MRRMYKDVDLFFLLISIAQVLLLYNAKLNSLSKSRYAIHPLFARMRFLIYLALFRMKKTEALTSWGGGFFFFFFLKCGDCFYL